MFRKDYLQRRLEEFGKVLAQLLLLKKHQNWEEFEKQTQAALENFTSLQLPEIEATDLATFRNTILNSEHLSYQQKKIIAQLLYEKMMYYQELGLEDPFRSLREKCKALYNWLSEDQTENEFDLDVYYKLKELNRE